jgi:hypothetical protein
MRGFMREAAPTIWAGADFTTDPVAATEAAPFAAAAA